VADGADRLSAPRLPPDFADLFVCLNEAGADYMLIGGYAVMVHGYLRATQDLKDAADIEALEALPDQK
jgi:hypothetical protein